LTIKETFDSQLDSFRRPTHEYVAALLDRDIRVLIFAGVHDWRCNWVGNDRFTMALQWHGRGNFIHENMRPWFVNGHLAGLTRGTQGLTFATVDGAGHMVSGSDF
jgi:carboxypeptidase C (cathepsin A)